MQWKAVVRLITGFKTLYRTLLGLMLVNKSQKCYAQSSLIRNQVANHATTVLTELKAGILSTFSDMYSFVPTHLTDFHKFIES